METLFVFLNVQLYISLRIGNLQILLEIGLWKRKKKQKGKTKNKNKSHIYHFLDYITLQLFVNANVIHHV